MKDNEPLFGWASAVDKIIRGDRLSRPIVVLGPTPKLLKAYGLGPGSLTMAVAKLARCRREHPEVPLDVWYELPTLLGDPLAVFPSVRRDGSIVILMLVKDRNNNPIVAAAIPDASGMNVVLSVYGKHSGLTWAVNQIKLARSEGLAIYERMDFAASLPQPPVAFATSSSHGPIPSDGTTKSDRKILSPRKKSTES